MKIKFIDHENTPIEDR